MGAGQKSRREAIKRWAENNPEEAKASKKASNDKWKAKNREYINKQARDNRRGKEILCEIKDKHQKEMKNDPESLSSDFMDTILKLDSNEYESLKSLPFLETIK